MDNPLARLREAGRVLSKVNEGKIKTAQGLMQQAHGHLEDVVQQVGTDAGSMYDGAPDARDLSVSEAGFQPEPYRVDPDEDVECDKCGKMNDADARYCDQCGAKLLGNPNVKVRGGTMGESARPGLVEKEVSDEKRQALADQGKALPSGGYPIQTVADLKRAIQAFGRAKDPAATKALITKRAKELNATDELPADWPGSTKQESAVFLTGDLIPLTERAVRDDGTVPIKVIAPGWGSSGYYPRDVLERDGPKVFQAGTHMYWDHPTVTEAEERPERSLRDLAAVLTEDARWDDRGPDGPGLYARAKVADAYREAVNDLAPYIGASIRASGVARPGEAEGRKGPVVESIVDGYSVDFVTKPGAGGRVLELFEAARSAAPQAIKEADMADQATATALQETQARVARLQEQLVLSQATGQARESLAEVRLPDVTKRRLYNDLLVRVPTTDDGVLDREAFAESIKAAVEQATLEFNEAIGTGRVTGMGSTATLGGPDLKEEDVDTALEEAFGRYLGTPAARR